jgi:hypothetical protein
MSFLFPAFLLGALAVAIPIVLHLTKRDVAPRVAFSDLRFLKRAPLMQSRRRRLRELLLLALRVTALLLLAFAFARPFIDPTGLLERGVTIVALDTSYSMTFPDGFARARAAARDAVAAAPSDHAVGVVVFDDRSRVASEPSLDRDASRLAIDRAVAGFGGTRYDGALQLAASLIGSREGQIVVVTDLQRAGWPDGSGVAVPSTVTAHDIGPATENLAVTAVELGPSGALGVVANTGASDRESTIRARVDDTVVGRVDVSLPRGATEVSMDVELPETGVLTIEVDDPGGLAADDRRFLLLDPPARTSVLVVAERASDRHEAFYLERALSAGGAQSRFRVRSVDPRELSDSVLDDAAAVLLVGATGLDRAARQRLRASVAEGAGLLIVAGPALESELVADLLSRDPRLRVGDETSPGLTWSVTNPRHPMFRPLGDRVGTLGQVRFRRSVQMDPAGGVVLGTFSGGAPALVEHGVGEGRVLVFGSDLGNVWNDFPRLPMFVPFVHEVTRYLSGERDPLDDLLVADAPPGVPAEPGVYAVPATNRRVVLNVDPRESDPARITAEEFQGWIGQRAAVSAQVGAVDDVTGREAEQGYWRYLILAMIGLLVVEAWLGRSVA